MRFRKKQFNALLADIEMQRPAIFGAQVIEGAVEELSGVYASYAIEVVYIIECGDRYVLIDTGTVAHADAHLANFRNAGIDLNRVDAILVTHCHYDHVSALAPIKEKLGCPVIAHSVNVDAIESGDDVATCRRLKYIPGYDFPFPPCKIDYAVEDGDTIEVGKTVFTAYHIPGHTAGDTGYSWHENLITGDLLFEGGETGWRDVHWGSNYGDIIKSMNRIKKINPKYCLPGHGRPWQYKRSDSDRVIRFVLNEVKKGPISPVFYTRQATTVKPDYMPRLIEIPERKI